MRSVLFCALMGCLLPKLALGAPPAYRLQTVTDALTSPWCVAFLPGGDFLATELAGALKRINADGTRVSEIAGVPQVYYAGQGGLFDVLVHPRFADNRVLYLSYAQGTPKDNGVAIMRARLSGNSLEDAKVIYRNAARKDTPVHYGGRMAWAEDGSLLLSSGDGFDYREAAQDRTSELGKLIRITEDGASAPGNPFANAPNVWSYGHRNPQGLAVDSRGQVYMHEHGPRGGDEVNVIQQGLNYGWPAITYGIDYNGAKVSPYTEWDGMEQPVHYWVPSIAPSGLAVYEGEAFPQWRGDLFVGALVDQEVRRLHMKDGQVVSETSMFSELNARVRDVRMGPDGALYLLTESPGRLVRVVAQ